MLEISEALGGTWEAVTKRWNLTDEFGYTQEESVLSLNSLYRLWPESVPTLLPRGAWGHYFPANVIDIGLRLGRVELYPHFERLLERLKKGCKVKPRDAAISELTLLSEIGSFSTSLAFEADVGSPDATCHFQGQPLAFEVFTPQEGSVSKEKDQVVTILQARLRETLQGRSCRVVLFDGFRGRHTDALVECMREGTAGKWIEVEGVSRFTIDDNPDPFDELNVPNGRVSVGFVNGKSKRQVINIGWEDIYARVERKLVEKRGQISRRIGFAKQHNSVVIDMTNLLALGEWADKLEGLDGREHGEIGAAILFLQVPIGKPYRMLPGWGVIENKAAGNKTANEFLERIEALDEAPFFEHRQHARRYMRG